MASENVHVKSSIRIMVALFFLFGIGIIWMSGLTDYLTLEALKSNIVWLSDQVANHYARSVIIYMVSFFVIAVSGLPGVALMSILGGYLFGIVLAVFYIIICATLGAIVFFLLVRYAFGNYLQKRYAAQLTRFNIFFAQKGWLFLLMLRCIAVIPFFMVNLFAGLTKIDLITFIWTTALGIIPTSLIFTYTGKQLATINCVYDIFTVPVMSALFVLILLFLIAIIVNKHWKIF